MSAHVLGEALVLSAERGPRAQRRPTDVREEPGQGIRGTVDGRRVAVGSRAFVRDAGVPADELASARA